MSTVSKSSIKMVSGGNFNTTNGTVFTTSSSQYAILTVISGPANISINGNAIASGAFGVFYVPPSTSVSSGASANAGSYVIFTNS